MAPASTTDATRPLRIDAVASSPLLPWVAEALLMLSLGTAEATAEPRARWPSTFITRVEVLALIETLNANLLASRSATLTLEKWCADHKMAVEPQITARHVGGVEKPASAETRQHLLVEADEPVKYRRVQLSCGHHVLSEADNWYVPSRLSEEMNHLLEATETPFGKVVLALEPFRKTIDAKMLWSPLPEGWESKDRGALQERDAATGVLDIPHEIFEHRAILYTREQEPFSEVDETYTGEILDFEIKPAPGP